MNIDRIARAMVDVEPSVDLEARIRARVREVQPARSVAWLSWRVAAPLVAAAAIALALVVRSLESRVQSPETRIAVQSATGLPTEAQNANVGPEVVKTSLLPKISTSRLSKAASTLSAEELAWMERRVPALDPVNALQVDHLRVDSIQPEPLAITPLTMSPVATESGGIERRNDR